MSSTLSNIVLSPFHLLTWSIRHFASTLLFLLSPFFIVLYYASYVFAPIYAPFEFLSRFEPIYIFCGTAAVIGTANNSSSPILDLFPSQMRAHMLHFVLFIIGR